jgi:ferredoxin
MKARVDRNICIGSAICVSIAPDVFELDNEGLSHVVDPDAGADDLLREAAENCPSQAIILEDDQGNQIYP